MKGKVELANPAAQALFGFSEDKIRNQTATALIGGYNFSRWLRANRRLRNLSGW
jgi:transcriptional regulator of aroF, aroG, tyrA and aromatic amino acid transport